MTTRQSVYPTLTYADPGAAIEFLTEALGLEVDARHEGPDGALVHAELGWDDGLLMIGTKSGESPFSLGPQCLYLTTDDPDGLFARAEVAGAEVVMGLTDQEYGSREFAVRDPEGNVWCFGTYQPTREGRG